MNKFAFVLLLMGIILTNVVLVKGQADLSISANYPNSMIPPGTFNMNVVIVNSASAKDGAFNTKITVYPSDPTYITVVGPSTYTQSGGLIPNDGKLYNGGQFTFQVAANTPPGSYSIVVQAKYNYGALFLGSGQDSVTLPLEVQSQVVSGSYWMQTIQTILPYVIIIIVIGIVAGYVMRSRKPNVTPVSVKPPLS